MMFATARLEGRALEHELAGDTCRGVRMYDETQEEAWNVMPSVLTTR